MGQIVGNSLKLAAAGAVDSLRLDTAPDGMSFLGLRLNIAMPVTVTGTPTLVQSDLVAFLKRALASFTLEEGPKNARAMPYAAADGNDLRTVHRYWLRNDVVNSVATGAAQTTGAQTMTASIFIPFSAPGWMRGTRRRPGTTQVRQMMIRAVEGSGVINGAVARAAGNCTIEVEYVCEPGADCWSPIPSMSRESSPRRDAIGPDGLSFLCYVPDTAHASSALTAFNVQIVDGSSSVRVTDLQSVKSIGSQFGDELDDQGASPKSIVDEHTVLYFAGEGVNVDELSHGRVRIEEAKSDLSPLNLRFVYLPARDALRAKAEAKASADALGGAVLLTQAPISEDADAGACSTMPVRVFQPSDARFTVKPGLLASAGSDLVSVSIPAAIKANVQAASKIGGKAGQDVTRRNVKIVSLAVPGSTGTDGWARGDVADAIARELGA